MQQRADRTFAAPRYLRDLDLDCRISLFPNLRRIVLSRARPQAGTTPEEMMRQMSIPDLAQKLDQAESTFGQVHPQVCRHVVGQSRV